MTDAPEPSRDARVEAGSLDLLEALAVPGLGPVTVRRLVRRFGSWQGARDAGPSELRDAGLRVETIRALRNGPPRYDASRELERALGLGLQVIPFTSPAYPAALRPHDHAPLLLFVKGELVERDAVAIAVVGTRRASLYGRMQSERLGFELARAGFTIVSGLARGIDAAAHEGALKACGRTLAVLGNGLASIYPRENEEMAERIVRNGALISEHLPDAVPAAENFPPRNRIIAALSLGVIVVEASSRSGSLITARLAGEMGKEVFAVPGDVGRPQTRGTHQLIRDGAKLVESLADVVEELGPLASPVQVGRDNPPLADPRALALNRHERVIYDMLDTTPKDIDLIIRESGLSAANVASTLMVLELKHLAVQMPGKLYARAGTFQRET